MDDELISDEDYDNLPPEPEKRFLAIEQICRRNMMALISHETSQSYDVLVRTQYMTIVHATAEELGIDGVQYIDRFDSIDRDLAEFMRIVSGVAAKLRLRRSSVSDGLSVRLANKTKGLVERELEKLRRAIANSDLSEGKKKILLARVEDFRTELHKERLRFGVSMAVLASLGAGLVGSTTLLADAPDAISTITHLIGIDKEHEDAEALRLRGPVKLKAIADHSSSGSPLSGKLDDDIPF